MNSTIAVPAAVTLSATRTRPRMGYRALWIVAIASCLVMLVVNVFRREGYTGDEGFYGVTAENMLRSSDYILRPSYFPLGDFVTDRDGFAHPPVNSYLYAVSLWAAGGSFAGPEVLNVLSFGALLLLVYRIMARFDRRAAQMAVLVLAASAPMVGYFSMLEAEPLMTVFGLAAADCALNAWSARRWTYAWLFAAGLCLGVSFALKLWLCAPLGLVVAVVVLYRARAGRAGVGSTIGGLALLGIGFVVPAAVHLFAVARYHPEDLGFWLRNIYFGVFTHAGISGSKLAGNATPAEWVHPVWYYAAALYRDHFFLVPPIVFGFRSLVRDQRLRGGLLLIAAAGLAGLAPLSLMKVKEPLYVLACAVFLYVVAGASLSALRRRFAGHRRLDSLSLWGGMVVTGGLLALFALAQAKGIQPDKITPNFVLAHTLVFGVFIAAVIWAHRQRSAALFDWTVFAACGIAIVALGAWNVITRAPRDATIARIVAPHLQDVAPTELGLIASNFKCYQYYTFHRGMYWHELPEQRPGDVLALPDYSRVRAFVFSPDDQLKPRNEPWLAWLETHAAEQTEELDRQLGRVSGYRVFTRK